MKPRLKIFTVVGTRPEAIKLAPVIQRLARHPQVNHKVVLGEQHRELLHSALAVFGIQSDINLGLMEENQTLAELNARALKAFEALYQGERPDWVIVQGDTTTAFAAALASFYHRISIAHVEAGLRTDDLYNPFPEEINRRFIDQLSTLHFAPTERARQNLLREGIPAERIFVTGNTGIDALLEVAARDGRLPAEVALAKRNGHRLLLVTAHRRENFGPPLANICLALRALVERNADLLVNYAVHPNPNVCKPVRSALGGLDRIHLTDALDYEGFVGLMKACELILTDSGGIQEEAPSLGKPVLVLRKVTEREEAIEAGTAQLVGTEPEAIVDAVERLLRDRMAYARMSQIRNPYGDGHAAERIVRVLTGGCTGSKTGQFLYEKNGTQSRANSGNGL